MFWTIVIFALVKFVLIGLAYRSRCKKRKENNAKSTELGYSLEAIWPLSEMDADHVSAWSKGGATDSKNCEMLCKTHNRAKGNR
jgi:hypothetical protein